MTEEVFFNTWEYLPYFDFFRCVSAKRTMLAGGGGSKKSVFARTSVMDDPLLKVNCDDE